LINCATGGGFRRPAKKAQPWLRRTSGCHPGLHRSFQGATWLWEGIILLLTVALAALMITEPANVFLLLTTAVTVALVVAGPARLSCGPARSCAGSLGLRLCFAQPEPGS